MPSKDKTCHGDRYHLVQPTDLIEIDGHPIRACLNCGKLLVGPFTEVKEPDPSSSYWESWKGVENELD